MNCVRMSAKRKHSTQSSSFGRESGPGESDDDKETLPSVRSLARQIVGTYNAVTKSLKSENSKLKEEVKALRNKLKCSDKTLAEKDMFIKNLQKELAELKQASPNKCQKDSDDHFVKPFPIANTVIEDCPESYVFSKSKVYTNNTKFRVADPSLPSSPLLYSEGEETSVGEQTFMPTQFPILRDHNRDVSKSPSLLQNVARPTVEMFDETEHRNLEENSASKWKILEHKPRNRRKSDRSMKEDAKELNDESLEDIDHHDKLNSEIGMTEALLEVMKEEKTSPSDSFDCCPKKETKNYKYQEVVRGKAERQKLDAFPCKQCEDYFAYLPRDEARERLRHVCRHKAFVKNPPTPRHFWDLGFPSTSECVERGYAGVTTQVAPPKGRRGRRYKAKWEENKDE